MSQLASLACPSSPLSSLGNVDLHRDQCRLVLGRTEQFVSGFYSWYFWALISFDFSSDAELMVAIVDSSDRAIPIPIPPFPPAANRNLMVGARVEKLFLGLLPRFSKT